MISNIRTLLAFFLMVSLVTSIAHAENCKHRIIFLPQSHAPDELTDAQTTEDQNNQVATSQLKVASYIERFPQVPIFSEQAAAQNYSLNMFPQDKVIELRSMFNQIFPKGLPDSTYKLTDIQKQKLINNGGDFVQLVRGRIAVIHRVVENQETLDKIFDPIKAWFDTNPSRYMAYPPEIGYLVYGAREKAALNQVQKFFSQNPTQRDVILIYGANHSFGFYPEDFPSQCIIIPPEFQSDWDGRFRSGPEGFPTATNKTKNSGSSQLVVERDASW